MNALWLKQDNTHISRVLTIHTYIFMHTKVYIHNSEHTDKQMLKGFKLIEDILKQMINLLA